MASSRDTETNRWWWSMMPELEDEDDKGGGQWAGPALAAAGLRREEAQVSFSSFCLFSNILTYVLI